MKRILFFFLVLCANLTHSQSYSICPGSSLALVVQNTASLSSPSYSINPGAAVNSTGTFVVSPTVSTTFTGYVTGTNSNNVVVTNTVTFNVTVHAAFSNFFTITSSSNFTLGCGAKGVAAITISQLNVPPGGVYSYTFLPPGFSGTLPSGPLSSAITGSFAQPGTYTAVVRDMTSGCDASIPFSILSNTASPSLSTQVATTVLTCYTPSVMLKGFSSSANTIVEWRYSGLPGGPDLDSTRATVSANASQTLVNNYTVTVTDNNNLCTSNAVITVNQNIMPPNAQIAGPAVLGCPTTTAVLTNISTTQVPPVFNPTLFVTVLQWLGPASHPTGTTSTFTAYLPGTYTMMVIDNNNGCKASATKAMQVDPNPPTVTQPVPIILCSSSAILNATVNPAATYQYTWTAPQGGVISGQSTGTAVVNTPGLYTLAVSNGTGCTAFAFYRVDQCTGLSARQKQELKIYPVPAKTDVYLEGAANLFENWKLIDLTGAEVRNGTVNSDKENIDLRGLRSGMYILKLEGSGNKTGSYRLIISD